MSVDAQLAKMLLDGSLQNSAADIVKAYQEAMEPVPKEARELDSVVKQLRLFAKFLRPKDDKSADVLNDVAQRLGGPAAPGSPSAPAVASVSDATATSAPATAAASRGRRQEAASEKAFRIARARQKVGRNKSAQFRQKRSRFPDSWQCRNCADLFRPTC